MQECLRTFVRDEGSVYMLMRVRVRVCVCVCVCVVCDLLRIWRTQQPKKFKQLKVGNWNDCDIIFARILFILQKKTFGRPLQKRTNLKTLAELLC